MGYLRKKSPSHVHCPCVLSKYWVGLMPLNFRVKGTGSLTMIRPSWVIPIKNRTVSSVILSLPSNHFKDLTVGHKVTLFLKVLLHSIKLWLGIYSTQKFNQGMKNLEHRTAYQAWLLFNLGSYHIREKVGVCLVCLKLLSSIQSWTYLLTLFVMSTLKWDQCIIVL